MLLSCVRNIKLNECYMYIYMYFTLSSSRDHHDKRRYHDDKSGSDYQRYID